MDPIDELLSRCLERPEPEWNQAIAAACDAHPEHAAELRRRFAQILQMTVPSAPAPDRIPERLGEFRILRRLGGGGMGVVYLAEQEPLGRTVALKLIRPDQLYFPGARERFRREVEAVARLSHPGIVPVHTVGEAEGLPYFAMEHVPGASLEDVLRSLPQARAATLTATDFHAALARACGTEVAAPVAGTWTDVCVRLVLQVAEALEHAHERGVLHRDVKPSNVMVTPAGECRLLDFGLAAAPGASRLTRTGAQMGSLPFMSPEQVAGRFDQVDRRSDLYSLGVTLYEILTLELPFHAETNNQLIRAIAEQDARDPRALNPSVSRDQSAVVLKALEKDPARRYQSAFAFAEDLRALLEGRPVAARPIGRLERGLRWARREPAWATVLVLIALALPAVAGALGYAAATREAAQVGRAKQRADQIERTLAGGFTSVMAGGKAVADAERAFRAVLALDPGNLDAMVGLGLMHLRARGGQDTLDFLDGEARQLAGRAAFQRMRSLALASLGRIAEAQAVRDREPEPDNLTERALLAEIATQEAWLLGEPESTRDALAQVSDVILASREARFLPFARQAMLASRLNDERLVRRTIAAMESLWPEEPLRWFVTGTALSRFDPTRAVAALRQHLAHNGADQSALVNLSGALERCGQDAEALASAQAAVAIDPAQPIPHRRLGRMLNKLDRAAEAVPHLVAALRENPVQAECTEQLSGILQRFGADQFPEAEQALLQAAEQGPLQFALQLGVGAYLGRVGRAPKAVPYLRRAVALRPNAVEAQVSLGSALSATGDGVGAEAALRRALELDPRHFAAQYNLGVALMREGDLTGAISAYRAALAIRDDDAPAHNNLGMVLGRTEGPEVAIAEFRRALALDPTLKPAHTNLLRQLRKLGDEPGIAEEEARWERATSRPASRK